MRFALGGGARLCVKRAARAAALAYGGQIGRKACLTGESSAYTILQMEENTMVFEKVQEMLAKHLDVEPSTITMESTFEDLGVDSLDTVEMVMDLEESLGIELELEQKVESVGQLVAIIEEKMG